VSNERQREQFDLYKADVKKRGKGFFPYAMFHDTVMSVVVVSVIIGLACIWYFDSGEEPGDAGILGPRYAAPADPATISFVPRPDWYFYFLFYLLRIFKWPNTVVLGTVGIPTLALVMLLLVPFIDRRIERRLSRRPVAVIASILVVVSMGILTWKGATAKEALASEAVGEVPGWIEDGQLVENSVKIAGVDADTAEEQVLLGATLFAQSGCLNCHTYQGSGGQNLGAPDLTEEGTKGRGIQWQIDHLKCPSCVNPGSPMPAFANLTEEQLTALAIFLEASQGSQGGG
jgi:menaquinol-cytochrome c reductase cytochrome b/c subunit